MSLAHSRTCTHSLSRSPVVILLLFLGWGAAQIPYAFILSTFFNSARGATSTPRSPFRPHSSYGRSTHHPSFVGISSHLLRSRDWFGRGVIRLGLPRYGSLDLSVSCSRDITLTVRLALRHTTHNNAQHNSVCEQRLCELHVHFLLVPAIRVLSRCVLDRLELHADELPHHRFRTSLSLPTRSILYCVAHPLCVVHSCS